MELVGLEPELASRYPTELSGGQQQRVGVARALAADPPVLLMDEPFGAVDPIVRLRLQEELLSLQRRVHKTIVFVTHDIDEAIRLADRMAVLNVGGVLEQYEPPVDVLAESGERLRARVPRRRPWAEAARVDPGVRQPSCSRDRRSTWASTTFDARTVMTPRGRRLGCRARSRTAPWLDRRGAARRPRADRSRSSRTRFPVAVRPSDSLRHALDTLVSSPTQVVIVVDDDDRYLGLLDVGRIGKGLGDVNAALRVLAGQPLIQWSYIGDHLTEIWAALVQHLQLTFIAVGVGLVISSVLAAFAIRFRIAFQPINA